MHIIKSYPQLVEMCLLREGLDWLIQVLGVPFVVLWSHSLGGYIGGESDKVGLEWGAGTYGVLP